MKKILISIILCGCKTAVSREIKTETRYNQIEINAAMDEIEMEFANCTLLELSFDETNEQNQNFDSGKIIVYGKIKVDETIGIENLEINSICDKFFQFWKLTCMVSGK